jgi:iron complex transport system substrate-binding protein
MRSRSLRFFTLDYLFPLSNLKGNPMKQPVKLAVLILVVALALAACAPAPAPTEEAPAPAVEEEEAQPEEEEAPPTEIPEEPTIESRFTIQADPILQDAVAALYGAAFQGEEPVFVEADADLIATESVDTAEMPAIFLPGVALIPLSDSPDAADFVAFAISPDGQQVLIDAGALPASVTLTDQAGSTVEVAQPVRRVISAHGPTTFLIYGVGAGDRLVAASYLGARDPAGAAAMERIDPRFPEIQADDLFSQENFNIEEAVSLEPDLIAASARTQWVDVAAELGIPVIQYEGETPERLREAMRLTGQLFGPNAAAQAEAWVAYYDSVFDAVVAQTASIPDEERVNVLFTGTEPTRVASGEMYQTSIIEAAGGTSASAELTGYWNDVNLEQIASWNPDVIIVPPYGGASVEAITGSAEWQILDAVQAGRVYRMPKLVAPWDTPAPDSVLGIIWMAQLLYPDLVELDCAAEADFFYNTFYGYAIPADEAASLCATE